MASKRKIRIGILGVGNVASVLVQALHTKNLEGVWHHRIGGYSPLDIEIVCAFDIARSKIGKDLSEAIFASPNASPRFVKVPKTGVEVRSGIMKGDASSSLGSDIVPVDSIVSDLLASNAEILLNLIPSGMHRTSLSYARTALKAGCSFVNATPAAVANNPDLRKRFTSRKQVLVGDDLMSQFGGTAFHKGILDFINSRGIGIEKSYQLDVGGGAETLNTISESVKMLKRNIKTASIASEIPYKFETVAGTTDYVDYMGNDRTSYFWLLGKTLFDSPIKIDVYLRTNDGTNAVNILLDVVRAVAKSKQLGKYGSPPEICDYGFKKLPKPVLLRQAHEDFYRKFAR